LQNTQKSGGGKRIWIEGETFHENLFSLEVSFFKPGLACKAVAKGDTVSFLRFLCFLYVEPPRIVFSRLVHPDNPVILRAKP